MEPSDASACQLEAFIKDKNFARCQNYGHRFRERVFRLVRDRRPGIDLQNALLVANPKHSNISQ
jgi:hypothetical protein